LCCFQFRRLQVRLVSPGRHCVSTWLGCFGVPLYVPRARGRAVEIDGLRAAAGFWGRAPRRKQLSNLHIGGRAEARCSWLLFFCSRAGAQRPRGIGRATRWYWLLPFLQMKLYWERLLFC